MTFLDIPFSGDAIGDDMVETDSIMEVDVVSVSVSVIAGVSIVLLDISSSSLYPSASG